uniref:Pyruvate carboxylase n=1 Tax=Ascaris lumbricoides TaxID=6252 RepID=A0A0M3IH84_ASCLU
MDQESTFEINWLETFQDMAGVMKPAAAKLLVDTLRDKFPDVPIHIHTHDTAGAGVASMLACAYAGADIVDAAVDSMSGMTSQPSMGAIVAALENTSYSTGLNLDNISRYSAYWESARQLYGPFECAVTMKSGNADVYKHEIPGGQYTNLQFQAFSLGLAEQFDEVKRMYREANLALGLNLDNISRYSAYWESARQLYGPFECAVTMKSGNADVYKHEIPGGQYTNLQFQAFSLGLAEQFDEVKRMYREANLALGDLIKVTPSSKVVGDLAQFMVQNHLDRQTLVDRAEDLSFPKSVVQFFQGLIGQPPYGFPEPLRTKVLRGLPKFEGRPGENLEAVDFNKLKEDLEAKHGRTLRDEDVMTSAMFPNEFDEFEQFRQQYGPVDKLHTRPFLTGLDVAEEIDVDIDRGKTLAIKLLAIGKLNNRGEREVFFDLNGQMRAIFVQDKEASKEIVTRPRAKPGVRGSIGAPMPGEILELKVKEGDKVEQKTPLFVLSAMKMEMVIDSPIAGTVKKIYCDPKTRVAAGDLVVEVEP